MLFPFTERCNQQQHSTSLRPGVVLRNLKSKRYARARGMSTRAGAGATKRIHYSTCDRSFVKSASPDRTDCFLLHLITIWLTKVLPKTDFTLGRKLLQLDSWRKQMTILLVLETANLENNFYRLLSQAVKSRVKSVLKCYIVFINGSCRASQYYKVLTYRSSKCRYSIKIK